MLIETTFQELIYFHKNSLSNLEYYAILPSEARIEYRLASGG